MKNLKSIQLSAKEMRTIKGGLINPDTVTCSTKCPNGTWISITCDLETNHGCYTNDGDTVWCIEREEQPGSFDFCE